MSKQSIINENVELKLKILNLLKGLDTQNIDKFIDEAKVGDYYNFGRIYNDRVKEKIKENLKLKNENERLNFIFSSEIRKHKNLLGASMALREVLNNEKLIKNKDEAIQNLKYAINFSLDKDVERCPTPLHFLIYKSKLTKNNEEVIAHLEEVHGNIPSEKLILIDWLFSKDYTTEQIESKINLILSI